MQSVNNNHVLSRFIAVSMFAPTGARRAFPCFDEPAYKAAFKLKIARYQGYKVQSNLMIEKEDEDV
jgi:aminopeptidase N